MKKAIDKVDKITMSPKKLQAVELWRETRGHISDLCSAVGISRQTYYDWMAEDPNFNLAIQNAEAELNDDMRKALIDKAADGSSSDIQFYLKKKHPEFKDVPNTLVQVNNYKDIVGEINED